ncbi:hypothetical protein [Nonomuraea sp. NPDC023979]|uniref:hypothetical protein n=1 Tax=Nonomuraea sp. NPDC023979 TaxID=3154796 RepID=UPI0033E56DB1
MSRPDGTTSRSPGNRLASAARRLAAHGATGSAVTSVRRVSAHPVRMNAASSPVIGRSWLPVLSGSFIRCLSAGGS